MTRDSPYPFLPLSELILVLACLTFVVGSICFLPGDFENVMMGDALFIIGSCVYLGKSFLTMNDQLHEHGLDIFTEGHLSAEFCENVSYFLACIIFTLGCMLWWPGVYGGNEDLKHRGMVLASWCFIFGSLGFVIASFCNAVLLSKRKMCELIPGTRGKLVYDLAFASLGCSQLGGVFFVTGSYMYRPGFNNHCERHIRAGWTDLAGKSNMTEMELVDYMAQKLSTSSAQVLKLMPETKWCTDVEHYGGWLFLLGSFFYLAQSMSYLLIALIKEHAQRKEEKATPKVWFEDFSEVEECPSGTDSASKSCSSEA